MELTLSVPGYWIWNIGDWSTFLSSENLWEKSTVQLFLGSTCMCLPKRTVIVLSNERGRWDRWKSLRRILDFTRRPRTWKWLDRKPLDIEEVGTIHLLHVRPKSWFVCGCCPCQASPKDGRREWGTDLQVLGWPGSLSSLPICFDSTCPTSEPPRRFCLYKHANVTVCGKARAVLSRTGMGQKWWSIVGTVVVVWASAASLTGWHSVPIDHELEEGDD